MDFTAGTLIPLVALGALGALLPIALRRVFPDTLHGLLQALCLSVVILVFVGAGLFVYLYARDGFSVGALAAQPADGARYFIALGLKASLVWAPILALTGISLGRGVEERRSRRLAARDRD